LGIDKRGCIGIARDQSTKKADYKGYDFPIIILHAAWFCDMSAESRRQESRKLSEDGVTKTALWFLFAFCFLLFISQVYPEQSINTEFEFAGINPPDFDLILSAALTLPETGEKIEKKGYKSVKKNICRN
jgi:hypothetical protein